ncbi:MAG: DNA-3-methyladenine glycosylase [Gemmatimonadaceae bacterium]|nr:DNA-3-methyladenine glycosylase [Gemmatimonadaceae bacterium]
MAGIVSRVGPCRFRIRAEGTHFAALTSSILYQQVSGAAASTIQRRLHELYGGRPPEPEEFLDTSEESLRLAGLSRQKQRYIRDLARHAIDLSLPFDELHGMSDDDVIAALTQVKGIGKWTAQMFLMFRLGRLDVLPDLDLGIRTAVQRAYRMRRPPDARRLHKVGARWAPYRTVASWYLWRSLGGQAAI